MTPVLLAAQYGNASIIKILAETLKEHDLFKSEIYAEDENGNNILHRACFNENKDVLTAVMADLKETPESLKTMLRKMNQRGTTPLLIAAEKSNLSVFTMLAETLKEHGLFKSEMFAEDNDGDNILHRACYNENKDVIITVIVDLKKTSKLLKMMLQKKGQYGLTPLLMAAASSNLSVFTILAETLKEHGLFESEMFAEDGDGDNILHRACYNENKDVLTAVIGELKETPELLKTMMRKKGQYGLTPLLMAAASSNLIVFTILAETLKEHGLFESEMFAEDGEGDNILHRACYNENKDVLTATIFELKETPELLKTTLRKKNQRGTTPLLLAAEICNLSEFSILAETLKEHGLFESEICIENANGNNILHRACYNENKDVITAVISELKETHELLTTMLRKMNQRGTTPLLMAAEKSNVSVFAILVERLKEHDLFESEMFIENANSDNILHRACYNENNDVLTAVIFELKKTPELLMKMLQNMNQRGTTPLHIAAGKSNLSVFTILVETLKERGLFESEIFTENADGDNILHRACYNKNRDVLTAVIFELKKTSELLKTMLQKKGQYGLTPLLMAAASSNLSVFSILAETLKENGLFESEMIVVDGDGDNILHRACYNVHKDVLEVVIVELKEIPGLLKTMLRKKGQYGLTPLLMAAASSNLSVFTILAETLKEHGLFESEMFAEDEDGDNILHRVCYNEDKDVLVAAIAELKEFPEFLKTMLRKKNQRGTTPLLMAAEKSSSSVFTILTKTLEEHGLFESEMFTENANNDNILHRACCNENKDVLMAVIVELNKTPKLLKLMLRKKGQYGLTPLLTAAASSNLSVFIILTETLKEFDLFNSEIFIEDEDGDNILHRACNNEDKDVLMAVIVKLKETPELLKTMLPKMNQRGTTPLLMAAEKSNLSVFTILAETLKEQGLFESEVFTKNMNGDNILHRACINENKDVLTAVITELKETLGSLKTMLEMKNNVGLTSFLLARSRDKMIAVQILTEVSQEFNLLIYE